jgi:hypothetical protein
MQEMMVLKLTEFVCQIQNFRKRNSLKFVFPDLIKAALRQQALDFIRLLKVFSQVSDAQSCSAT